MDRLRQVIKYGWLHAGEISQSDFSGKRRLSLFCDIMLAYRKFGMWSNQYSKERFWELDNTKRQVIGGKYQKENAEREEWVRDFYENRKFLSKWSMYNIEASAKKRERRNKAYRKRYNMGEDCLVEHGVEISRQHYLPGTISIGNHVLLAKHVFIDYSGFVEIKDNVQLTNGVIIETHHHAFHSDPGFSREIVLPTSLVIEEGAVLGSRAIVLSSCHYIGKNSRIGAGAVVTKNVPDYVVVVGVPAKVVKMLCHE